MAFSGPIGDRTCDLALLNSVASEISRFPGCHCDDVKWASALHGHDILCNSGSGRRAAVRVLPDEEARRTPREATAGSTPWPAWTWRAYDAFRLADAARAAFAAISPKVPFRDPRLSAAHGSCCVSALAGHAVVVNHPVTTGH